MEKNKMRYTEEELALVKATFKGNEPLLKLLRKTFLPEYDPYAPIGQVVDLWMTVDIKQLSPQEAYIRLLARNELITHVDSQLMQLAFLAELNPESPTGAKERAKKDSAK